MSQNAAGLQAAVSDADMASMVSHLRCFRVAELKELCKSSGLAIGGRKQEIFDRIIQFIGSLKVNNSLIELLAMRTLILKLTVHAEIPTLMHLVNAIRSGAITVQQMNDSITQFRANSGHTPARPAVSAANSGASSGAHSAPAAAAASPYSAAPSLHQNTSGYRNGMFSAATPGQRTSSGAYNSAAFQAYQRQMSQSSAAAQANSETYNGPMISYRSTVFYTLRHSVGGVQVLRVSKGRAYKSFHVGLTSVQVEQMRQSPKMRLYLFCCAESTPDARSAAIQYPPIEIYVDGTLTKQSVRGIKGKPGTARPADLTQYIPSLDKPFSVRIVYSDASERFLMDAYIVEAHAPEEIMAQVVQKPHISSASTRQALKEENDRNMSDDIVLDNVSLSLRCPITYARLIHPAKSIQCDHVQCFDGLSFFMMQERIPAWQCPVCSKQINENSLAVSEYLKEILDQTPDDVDTVRLDLDGGWTAVHEGDEPAKKDTRPKPESATVGPSASASAPVSVASSAPASAPVPAAPADDSIEIISLDTDSEAEAEPDSAPLPVPAIITATVPASAPQTVPGPTAGPTASPVNTPEKDTGMVPSSGAPNGPASASVGDAPGANMDAANDSEDFLAEVLDETTSSAQPAQTHTSSKANVVADVEDVTMADTSVNGDVQSNPAEVQHNAAVPIHPPQPVLTQPQAVPTQSQSESADAGKDHNSGPNATVQPDQEDGMPSSDDETIHTSNRRKVARLSPEPDSPASAAETHSTPKVIGTSTNVSHSARPAVLEDIPMSHHLAQRRIPLSHSASDTSPVNAQPGRLASGMSSDNRVKSTFESAKQADTSTPGTSRQMSYASESPLTDVQIVAADKPVAVPQHSSGTFNSASQSRQGITVNAGAGVQIPATPLSVSGVAQVSGPRPPNDQATNNSMDGVRVSGLSNNSEPPLNAPVSGQTSTKASEGAKWGSSYHSADFAASVANSNNAYIANLSRRPNDTMGGLHGTNRTEASAAEKRVELSSDKPDTHPLPSSDLHRINAPVPSIPVVWQNKENHSKGLERKSSQPPLQHAAPREDLNASKSRNLSSKPSTLQETLPESSDSLDEVSIIDTIQNQIARSCSPFQRTDADKGSQTSSGSPSVKAPAQPQPHLPNPANTDATKPGIEHELLNRPTQKPIGPKAIEAPSSTRHLNTNRDSPLGAVPNRTTETVSNFPTSNSYTKPVFGVTSSWGDSRISRAAASHTWLPKSQANMSAKSPVLAQNGSFDQRSSASSPRLANTNQPRVSPIDNIDFRREKIPSEVQNTHASLKNSPSGHASPPARPGETFSGVHASTINHATHAHPQAKPIKNQMPGAAFNPTAAANHPQNTKTQKPSHEQNVKLSSNMINEYRRTLSDSQVSTGVMHTRFPQSYPVTSLRPDLGIKPGAGHHAHSRHSGIHASGAAHHQGQSSYIGHQPNQQMQRPANLSVRSNSGTSYETGMVGERQTPYSRGSSSVDLGSLRGSASADNLSSRSGEAANPSRYTAARVPTMNGRLMPSNAERYSKTAFDNVMGTGSPTVIVRGILGIELAKEAFQPMSDASPAAASSDHNISSDEGDAHAARANTTFSPLNDRIEGMAIHTPNGKKRSMSGDGYSARTWNKRMSRPEPAKNKFDPSAINSSDIIELDD